MPIYPQADLSLYTPLTTLDANSAVPQVLFTDHHMLAGGTAVGGYYNGSIFTTTSPAATFYFDPADYPSVNGKTAKLRVRTTIITNATPPGASVGLFSRVLSVTSSGAGNATTISAAIGATGISAATVSNPGANTVTQTTSGWVAMPVAATLYVFRNDITGATLAAGAAVMFASSLELHYE